MSNKKIISIIIAAVILVISFVAGYFIADKFFSKDSDKAGQIGGQKEPEAEDDNQTGEDGGEEAPEDYSYLIDNEKLGNGDLTVDQTEFYYFCATIYDNLASTSFQYDYYYGEGYGAMLTGFDWKLTPDEQKYPNEIEGIENPTFADYIEDSAKKQIITTKAYVDYAERNGITLNESELDEIDSYIEQSKVSFEAQGSSLSEYLTEYFGENMTEKKYIEIVNERYLINKIDTIKSGFFGDNYTTEALEKIYSENLTLYGAVTLRNYVIRAEKVITGEETAAAVTQKTMDDAKAKAENFADAVTDSESFKLMAANCEKELGNQKYNDMITEDSYTLLKDTSYDVLSAETGDSEFASWAISSERKAGETYIVEIENTGYIVYMMVDPVHKIPTEYIYDVRHVLLQFGENQEGASDIKAELLDTSKYGVNIDIDVDLETTKDPALYMETQDKLIEYLEGDCTEDSFAALAKKYSSDGNASQGGIYEDVTKGYMVAEFENWALEEGRQAGDVGIVETEFGYHIMYFIRKDEVSSWESVIKEERVYSDVMDFSKKLTDRYTLSVEDYSGEKTVKEINDLAKKTIDYYNSMIG